MLLIDAIYINNGGAKVLLEYLLEQLDFKLIQYTLLLDNRISLKNKNSVIIKNSEFSRRKYYKNNLNKFSKIFCFANVPPPISIYKIDVYIYFHNILFLKYNGIKFSLKEKIMLKFKLYYIKYLNKNFYKWVVQTSYVQDILRNTSSFQRNDILIIPFYNLDLSKKNENKKNHFNFAYISNGSKHKNHLVLLDAWIEINKIYNYKLILTIGDSNTELIKKINLLQNKGCLIENVGEINHFEAIKLLQESEYLIFPSLYESFGMPLIEGAFYNCKIIASDLPYVYQVIYPSKTFNPNNKKSIVEAVLSANILGSSKLIATNQINNLINILK